MRLGLAGTTCTQSGCPWDDARRAGAGRAPSQACLSPHSWRCPLPAPFSATADHHRVGRAAGGGAALPPWAGLHGSALRHPHKRPAAGRRCLPPPVLLLLPLPRLCRRGRCRSRWLPSLPLRPALQALLLRQPSRRSCQHSLLPRNGGYMPEHFYHLLLSRAPRTHLSQCCALWGRARAATERCGRAARWAALRRTCWLTTRGTRSLQRCTRR